MLKNYFRTSWRNLLKNKTISLVNIAGLSIGISASLVIFLLVQYDLSFDKSEKDNNRIYRVVADYNFTGTAFHSSAIADAMPAAIKNGIAGIEQTVPFRTWTDDVKVSVPVKTSNDATSFKIQKNIVFADQDYFKLMPYTWLQGSPQTALQNPYQVVLTKSNLEKYLPGLTPAEAIGKEIIFNDSVQTTITGIVEDLSFNTDFSFKTFVSKATIETPRLKPDDGDGWGSASPSSQLFVKLAPNEDPKTVQLAISRLYKKNVAERSGNTISFRLQPLADLHFNADFENFNGRVAHKSTLYGLLAIGVFLLLLGCINFINLTTAQASQRAREIGVRKTLGSSKKQLVFQFLSETFLLTLVAGVFSIFLVPLIIKLFADFIPSGPQFNLLQHPDILLFLAALVLIVSVCAGLYPAFVLSSYKPVNVLKGQVILTTGKSGNILLRKSFIVSQFVIAQVFIIATILVAKQVNYSLTQDLGFKKSAIIDIQTSFRARPESRFLLLNKLKEIPGIKLISLSNNPPTSVNDRGDIIKYAGNKTITQAHAQVKLADTNYIKLYQIKILAGSNLSPSDTLKTVLINETCAHALGFRDLQQAVGKYVEINSKKLPIAGVVHDFHQKSFHEPINPLVISSKLSDQLLFNILLQPQNEDGSLWKKTIDQIKSNYEEVYPGEDFEYHFLDESIAQYYLSEQNLSRLLAWATAVTILISCLGLFALAVYMALQRRKEIGVRKIVGASVSQIVFLLVKDFVKPVIIAFIISMPIAWYGANVWLQNFAYKTELSWWIFIVTGCSSILVALATIGFQSIKAAIAIPVESLRTE
jgi:putative ABC transport system permease protein